MSRIIPLDPRRDNQADAVEIARTVRTVLKRMAPGDTRTKLLDALTSIIVNCANPLFMMADKMPEEKLET